ncbi:hypothetical protein GE09DRAFT_59127 [Coniochaeta sp. 2T2.1]|nr:hypothetical protein GE09DRAFT_59127 [Coniochaeta sp. 2T2.1]
MQDQDNLFPSNLSPNDFDVDIKHPSMTEDRRRLNPPSLIPPTVQGGRMMLCAPVRSLSEGWTETVPEMLRRGMQQCRQCKRLFHNKDSLNNHIKTNTMFTCPVPQCEGRGFRYRTDVVHHFHTVHRKEEMCSPACGRPGANAGAPPAKGPDVHCSTSFDQSCSCYGRKVFPLDRAQYWDRNQWLPLSTFAAHQGMEEHYPRGRYSITRQTHEIEPPDRRKWGSRLPLACFELSSLGSLHETERPDDRRERSSILRPISNRPSTRDPLHEPELPKGRS